MKRIRFQTVLLALWLGALFNIERFDINRDSVINLASSFYVLVMLATIAILFIRTAGRQPHLVALGTLTSYALFQVFDSTPVFSGMNKYVTITEVAALLVTVGLASLLSQALQDFEQAVEAISLPQGHSGLLSYNETQKQLHAELGRARRHQRPLSVAMIKLEPKTYAAALHRAVREAQAAMLERYVHVRVGTFLARHIRDTDVIAHHAQHGHFLLVAPEADGQQTTDMLRRLSGNIEAKMGIQMHYSIADFPNVALTSDELLRRASEDLQRAPAPASVTDAAPEQTVPVT